MQLILKKLSAFKIKMGVLLIILAPLGLFADNIELVAACSQTELAQKICELKSSKYRVRLSASKIFVADLIKRKVYDFPVRDEGSEWSSIEWMKLNKFEILNIKVWSAPAADLVGLQQLKWMSYIMSEQELKPFFELNVSSRRRREDGSFQFDPLSEVEIYIENNQPKYRLKERSR